MQDIGWHKPNMFVRNLIKDRVPLMWFELIRRTWMVRLRGPGDLHSPPSFSASFDLNVFINLKFLKHLVSAFCLHSAPSCGLRDITSPLCPTVGTLCDCCPFSLPSGTLAMVRVLDQANIIQLQPAAWEAVCSLLLCRIEQNDDMQMRRQNHRCGQHAIALTRPA